MPDNPLNQINAINWSTVFQNVVSTLIAAAIAAMVFLFFWAKVRKHFLDDRYKIPLVEINPHTHVVRNIGQETALNIVIFHVCEEIPQLSGQMGLTTLFRTSIPNMAPGESSHFSVKCQTCFNQEFFIAQYSNLSGVNYWCIQLAPDGKGNPWATIPPYRTKALAPCIGEEQKIRLPWGLRRQFRAIQRQRGTVISSRRSPDK